MMGVRPHVQDGLFAYGVTLEKPVPPEHPLRKIAAAVDLSFPRAVVAGSYGKHGHVGEDPVMIVKLTLADPSQIFKATFPSLPFGQQALET